MADNPSTKWGKREWTVVGGIVLFFTVSLIIVQMTEQEVGDQKKERNRGELSERLKWVSEQGHSPNHYSAGSPPAYIEKNGKEVRGVGATLLVGCYAENSHDSMMDVFKSSEVLFVFFDNKPYPSNNDQWYEDPIRLHWQRLLRDDVKTTEELSIRWNRQKLPASIKATQAMSMTTGILGKSSEAAMIIHSLETYDYLLIDLPWNLGKAHINTVYIEPALTNTLNTCLRGGR